MKKETIRIDLRTVKSVRDNLLCVQVPFVLSGYDKKQSMLKIEVGGGSTVSFSWGIPCKIYGKEGLYVFVKQGVVNCSPKNIDEKMESLMKKLYTYSKSKKISSDIEDGIKRVFKLDTNVKVIGLLPKGKIQNIINNLIEHKLCRVRKGLVF
jgi:hypothetical protein